MPLLLLLQLCRQFAILLLAVASIGVTSANAQTLFGDTGPLSRSGSTFGSTLQSGVFASSGQSSSLGGTTGSGMPAFNLFGGSMSGTQGGTFGSGFTGRSGAAQGLAGGGLFNQQGTGFNQSSQTSRTNSSRTNLSRQNSNRQNFNRGGGNNRRGANNRGFGQQGSGANNRPQRVIRPRQRVAFTPPQVDSSTISNLVRAGLDRIPAVANSTAPGGIDVTWNSEGALMLRGNVDTAGTKRLAEMMARLQPGVSQVQNELIVVASISPE
jgi:hypothetical protein